MDVNLANDYGDTALMVATKDGDNCDLLGEIITQKNVDLNVRGRLGYTLLMLATLKGNFDGLAIVTARHIGHKFEEYRGFDSTGHCPELWA